MKTRRQIQRDVVRIHSSRKLSRGEEFEQHSVRRHEGDRPRQKCFDQLRDATAFAVELRRALANRPADPDLQLRNFEIESVTIAALEARAAKAGEPLTDLVRRILAAGVKQ